jgi:crotonobetainyl-CoA:carnitine CoA-transferase CaiB-like acyl-CoA transferase
VRHLGIARPLEHPELGDIRVVGQPVTLSRTPSEVATPTPAAGEHNGAILAELGYDEAGLARLRAEGVI